MPNSRTERMNVRAAWLLAASAVVAMACGGARATANQTDDPPQFQLGDSVTMPTHAMDHSQRSEVAFYIPEKDLLPESVAYDAKDRSFYVGSTRKGKIVRVDARKNVSDFIAPRQDGLWQVIGIKVHPTRRVMWVCSFDEGNLEGFKRSNTTASGVFQFNLDTGKLIRKWVLDAPGEVHAFNDVVLTRGNDAYVTHMFAEPAVYRIGQQDQKLEVFLKTAGQLTDINGITMTPDEKTLFVAGNEGVMAIDIASRKSRMITAPESGEMRAIDGLYFYRGSLIGVLMDSIARYRLDDSQSRVIMTEFIEIKHPLMDIPTTGVLVGDDFYYVANAQFGAVRPDGTLDTAKLHEPAILKLKLQ